MATLVVFRTFNTRAEAEAVRAVLSGCGIEARVRSDDCGAVDPALAFGRGVELLVPEDDVERAAGVLAEAESSEGQE